MPKTKKAPNLHDIVVLEPGKEWPDFKEVVATTSCPVCGQTVNEYCFSREQCLTLSEGALHYSRVKQFQIKQTRNTNRPKADKQYEYIHAWGLYLLSNYNYIARQVEKARKDDAPCDAIYYSEMEGNWATVRECVDPKTKTDLEGNAKIIRAYLNGGPKPKGLSRGYPTKAPRYLTHGRKS